MFLVACGQECHSKLRADNDRIPHLPHVSLFQPPPAVSMLKSFLSCPYCNTVAVLGATAKPLSTDGIMAAPSYQLILTCELSYLGKGKDLSSLDSSVSWTTTNHRQQARVGLVLRPNPSKSLGLGTSVE